MASNIARQRLQSERKMLRKDRPVGLNNLIWIYFCVGFMAGPEKNPGTGVVSYFYLKMSI
jgi:hypothetical protein